MFATPRDLITMFRSVMHDAVAPYLFTDPELYVYMTEGEAEVARRTLCIQDMTSAATVIAVSMDDPMVPLNQAIVRIRYVWWRENGGDYCLDIRSVDDVISCGPRILTQKGRPNIFMTGAATDAGRLYPIPQNDGEVVLSVYRVPLNPLSSSATFEIPYQYRAALLEWMRYRAYMKEDVETYDPRKGQDAQNLFATLVDGYETTESQRRGGPQSGSIHYGGL